MVAQLSDHLGIDCDFLRRDAYVFTDDPDKVSAVEAEVDAAKSLGLPATLETTIKLPFPLNTAVKFSRQAQFHPRKFLLPLAEKFITAGRIIYE
jgi:hypothetical protein